MLMQSIIQVAIFTHLALSSGVGVTFDIHTGLAIHRVNEATAVDYRQYEYAYCGGDILLVKKQVAPKVEEKIVLTEGPFCEKCEVRSDVPPLLPKRSIAAHLDSRRSRIATFERPPWRTLMAGRKRVRTLNEGWDAGRSARTRRPGRPGRRRCRPMGNRPARRYNAGEPPPEVRMRRIENYLCRFSKRTRSAVEH